MHFSGACAVECKRVCAGAHVQGRLAVFTSHGTTCGHWKYELALAQKTTAVWTKREKDQIKWRGSVADFGTCPGASPFSGPVIKNARTIGAVQPSEEHHTIFTKATHKRTYPFRAMCATQCPLCAYNWQPASFVPFDEPLMDAPDKWSKKKKEKSFYYSRLRGTH